MRWIAIILSMVSHFLIMIVLLQFVKDEIIAITIMLLCALSICLSVPLILHIFELIDHFFELLEDDDESQ